MDMTAGSRQVSFFFFVFFGMKVVFSTSVSRVVNPMPPQTGQSSQVNTNLLTPLNEQIWPEPSQTSQVFLGKFSLSFMT